MTPPAVAICPACHRPVAMARPTCLYCGAPLPSDAQAAVKAAQAEPEAAPPSSRALLVVDASGASPSALASLLGLSAFEAGLRARAGGLHLHRVGPAEEVGAEATILAEAGLRALSVPEAEARVAPVLATRGEAQPGVLLLGSAQGGLSITAENLLLVVEGPIHREYQAREVTRRKVNTAGLEPGYRIHLHPRRPLAPVELDPGGIDFGPRGPVAGSSLLELKSWIAGLGTVTTDDGFRRLPPAMGPAAPEEGAAASLARGLATGAGGRRDEARLVMDNLAQFRFYSGWRAAAERRLRKSSPGRRG